MEGAHVTEAVWLRASKFLPNGNRDVLIVFMHYNGKSTMPVQTMSAGSFDRTTMRWNVYHPSWNSSLDYVTQWAEIENKRQGCMPDPFQYDGKQISFVSNIQ